MSEEQDDKSIEDYISDSSPDEQPEGTETVETPEPGAEEQPQEGEQEPDETSELPEGLKKRFSKLTADRHRLKSANEEAERKLAEYEAKIQKYETKGPERPQRPTMEDEDVDFDDEKLAVKMDQYFEDLADWKAQQRLGEFKQEGAVQEIQNRKQQLAKDYQNKVSESGIEDYDAKFDNLVNSFVEAQAPIPDHFVEAIQIDEHGPKIVEYFSNNPKVAVNIASMGTVQAALEIGRISAKISAGKPIQQSNAPPVVKPIKGTGARPKDTESMSISDWVDGDLSHLGFSDR